MYCKKLLNIINHPMSKSYMINLSIINSLDEFLKMETGIILPDKLNPIKFAIKQDVDDVIAVMCFVLGAKVGLFKTRTYFNCTECNEMHEVEDITSPLQLECECGKELIPNHFRENVFLYFELLSPPEDCNQEYSEIIDYIDNPLDFLLSDIDLGKQNVSLATVVNLVGEEFTYSIVSQRGEYMEKVLEGAINIEFNQ